MNKEKIKQFIKNNKLAVSVSGVVITVGLLSGIGYGVHKLNANNNNNNISSGIVARSESDEIQKSITSSSDESKNSDTGNSSVDGNKQDVNNGTDENKTINENKQENSTTSSENNKKDDVKNGENKPSSSSRNEKASLTITTDGSKVASTSNGTNQTTNSTPSHNTTTNSHSHSWTPIKKTVHHKEQGHYENVLVKPAWTEKVPVYDEREVMICNDCGAELSTNDKVRREHIRNHILNGGKGSWREEWRNVQVGTKTVKHEAVYKKKWVVDKKAYDETITTGYKCSCGATK